MLHMSSFTVGQQSTLGPQPVIKTHKQIKSVPNTLVCFLGYGDFLGSCKEPAMLLCPLWQSEMCREQVRSRAHLAGVEHQLHQLRHQSIGHGQGLQIGVHQGGQQYWEKVTKHSGLGNLFQAF